MFPIRDINPTRIFPIITIGLIVASLFIFFGLQSWTSASEQEINDFLYENAAVACELTTGEPLSHAEIDGAECNESSGDQPFPEKNLYLSAFVSMFLHGGIAHVLLNMWFLWIFGNNVEEAFGALGFLAMYLVAGVVATAAFVLLNPDETEALVGASGAIAGVMGSYLVLFPKHRVLSLVFVFFVPVSAMLFLGIWFFLQFGIQEESAAWEAHVAGFAFGVLVTLPLRNRLLARVATLHGTRRLRV